MNPPRPEALTRLSTASIMGGDQVASPSTLEPPRGGVDSDAESQASAKSATGSRAPSRASSRNSRRHTPRLPHAPLLSPNARVTPQRAGSRKGSLKSRGSRASVPVARPLTPPPDFEVPPAPTISSPSESEQKDIASHIAKKRSRKFLRRKSSSQSSESEVRESLEELDLLRKQAAEACQALKSKHIELLIDGRTVHSEVELGDMDVPNRRYVWEVMYENQRGMTLWGKSWYSSNTLLPSDPTQFTLPLKLPSTEVTEVEQPTGKSRTWKTRPRLFRKSIQTAYTLETYQTPSPAWVWLTPWMVNMRSKTDEQGWEYNLWFHSKSWRPYPGHLNWWGWVRRREWVRLRQLVPEIIENTNQEIRDADNDFWGRHTRYSSERSTPAESPSASGSARGSAIFPTPSRESVASHNAMKDKEREHFEVADDGEVAIGFRVSRASSTTTDASDSTSVLTNPRQVGLGVILDTANPIVNMVRILSLAALDREKQEALNQWIGEGSKGEVNTFKDLLRNSENLEALSRAFVFPASRKAMFTELVKRGIISSRVCNDCLSPPTGATRLPQTEA